MKAIVGVSIGGLALALLLCPAPALAQGGGGGGGHIELFGNNLSFPVIWAEGVTKALRGTPGMIPLTGGEWMFWWGTDPVTEDPLSCWPNATADGCLDGRPLGTGAIRAYLQKDEINVWQAGSVSGVAGSPVLVDTIDWATTSSPRTGTTARRCAPRWCCSRTSPRRCWSTACAT